MTREKSYVAIDLKSFYASVECVERGLDPLNTNLVVADERRSEKTICLAVSPSLKQYGIPGRPRLFEVVQKVKEIAASVRDELKEQGVPFGNVAIGIMIETPAAAIISEDLAKEVDFFSIGTNDLVQYTLAIDRQNEKLDEFYDPKHPAVLRLIRFVAESGHKYGCMVGICGELGAETDLTEDFLKMGIDELSVSPSFLLKVREKIRQTDLTK